MNLAAVWSLRAFHATQHAVRAMLGQGAGHVVTVTCTLVEHADSRVPSVLTSLTKGGLSAATRSWPSSTPHEGSGSTPSPPE